MKDRADKVLLFLGLARSRSHAKDLIGRNKVKYRDDLVTKAGQIVDDEGLELLEEENVVGRGALKIASFLNQHPLDFQNKSVADIGASTGGFTQMALELGARKVFAVDVGHGQLAPILQADERVLDMQGTNVKNEFHLPEPCQIMTVDLSFISTAAVLPNLATKIAEHGLALILFKPQFEVGAENLGAKALVQEQEAVLERLNHFVEIAGNCGLKFEKMRACGLKGKKSGNQEFFVLFSKATDKVKNDLIKELP